MFTRQSPHHINPWRVVVALVVLSGCDRSTPPPTPPTVASAPAGAPAAAVQTPVDQVTNRLVGKWRETEEFGGDPNRPAERAPTLELRRDGTYINTYPASSGAPLEGTWRITGATGDSAVMTMTMRMGEDTLPVDPQNIVFRSDGTLEKRNALNGHGGVYTRIAP